MILVVLVFHSSYLQFCPLAVAPARPLSRLKTAYHVVVWDCKAALQLTTLPLTRSPLTFPKAKVERMAPQASPEQMLAFLGKLVQNITQSSSSNLMTFYSRIATRKLKLNKRQPGR